MALDIEVLLQNGEFSDAFIESLPAPFFMYDIGSSRLVKWNALHAKATGYEDEELAQKRILDWFRTEDRERVSEALAVCLDQGSNRLEIEIETKDGSLLPCMLSATKTTIGETCYIIGLGMSHGADESERRLFRDFFQNNPSAICVFTGNGSITEVNPRFLRMMCAESDAIVGRRIFDFCRTEAAKDFSLAARRVGDGNLRSYTFETELRRHDGESVFVEATTTLLCARDGVPRIACVMTDNTRNSFSRMELERALSEKTTLLQEIRHRVGNNLQILASLMRLIKKRYSESEDFSEAVLGRVETMALIYLHMIESRGIADLRLADFVTELTENVQTMYSDGGSSVVIETQLPRSYAVDSDKVLTLGLLISEMIRAFIEVGGRYTRERLRVSAEQRDHALRLEIVSASHRLPAAFYDRESDESLLVVVLTDQLGGSLEIRQGSDERWTGTCFEVLIPDSAELALPRYATGAESCRN